MTLIRQNINGKNTTNLPYIPPKVKPELNAELNENSFINIPQKINNPTDIQIASYIKNCLNGNKYGRYPKKLFNSKNGIIFGKNGLYAIYNEGNNQTEVADPGKFGKIKLVKNLYTNEWLILKTQLLEQPANSTFSNYIQTHVYKNEHEILTKLQLTNEPIMIRRSAKNNTLKGYIIMKYAKGFDLFTLLKQQINKKNEMYYWPDLFWLHVCIRVTEALLKEVNAYSILHCDIKFENFMYDIANDTGHVIDFGNAQKQQKPSVNLINLPIDGFNAPENFNNQYSEKSEVYAFSNILEGLLCHRVPNIYLTNSKTQTPEKYQIPSHTLCGRKTLFTQDPNINNFLKKMRSFTSIERPTLHDTLLFLKMIYQSYLENPNYLQDVNHINKILADAKNAEKVRLETANKPITQQGNKNSSATLGLFKLDKNTQKIIEQMTSLPLTEITKVK